MTGSSTDRATTLKQAFRVCNLGALTGADIDRYYVELSAARSREAIDTVSAQLGFLDPGEPAAILFTGHRGCGKSTELKRIQRRWELASEGYEVIYIKATEELDINDTDYKDIYLVVIKAVTEAIQAWGLQLEPKLVQEFENWFKEITGETEEKVEKSVSLSASAEAGQPYPFVFKLMVKLLSQIKGSDTYKRTIREDLQQGFSRLQENTNNLLKDAYAKLREKKPNCKGFLIILDNLDRVPPHVGEHLFLKYASQLRDLHCAIIYTVPISVIYSGQNYSNAFGSLKIMPMVNVYRFDRETVELEPDLEGLELMAQLIEQRIDVDQIFDSRELVRKLVRLSGGHVRQLMQLTRAACLTASTRGHKKIMAEDIDYSASDERGNFERFIPADHYPVLAQICRSKESPRDPEMQAMMQSMLFNITVLEYVTGNQQWMYVNPLVRQIHAFKESL
ncbi:MAG: ATP-binding protein [Leptolyngbyaceae cyanobacterium MO_188.B28]|nr:ATP-binding protein [Leptolyngbyaceae cyanobacterium MO_188.B28]